VLPEGARLLYWPLAAWQLKSTLMLSEGFVCSRVLGLLGRISHLTKESVLATCLRAAACKLGLAGVPPLMHRSEQRSMEAYGFWRSGMPTWELVASVMTNRLFSRPSRVRVTGQETLFDAGEADRGQPELSVPTPELEAFCQLPNALGSELPNVNTLDQFCMRNLLNKILTFGVPVAECLRVVRETLPHFHPFSPRGEGLTVIDIGALLTKLRED